MTTDRNLRLGKSSLVSQAQVELGAAALGTPLAAYEEANADIDLEHRSAAAEGHIVGGLNEIIRLIQVDQKPIGRTPRSDIATYAGLFDQVRALISATQTLGGAATKRPLLV